MGEFYSYSGEARLSAVMEGSGGYLSTFIRHGNPSEVLLNNFFEKEGTISERVDSVNSNKNLDQYTNGIFIPITNEEAINYCESAS